MTEYDKKKKARKVEALNFFSEDRASQLIFFIMQLSLFCVYIDFG